jgi:DNA helicase II / ATP-dependent DNA helicase PcrA
VLAETGGDERAYALLAAADRLTGITRVGLPHGDSLLDGAQSSLDQEAGYIWYDAEIDASLALFCQAHEYAHLWLHGKDTACDDSDVDPNADEDDIPMGVQRVEAYGPSERQEREANVFAREFLLPLDLVREWYVVRGQRVSTIVQRTGLSESIVLHQLARGVLVPEADPSRRAAFPSAEFQLDPSQEAAAHAPRGPVLVDAGPGTGKTRTLCGRVVHLLNARVPPRAILALTFSNRAAEEMRERVAQVRPDAALQIWMSTFHAYGLELLRKYGSRLGLSPTPEVLDPSDAVLLLESRLAELDLVHYQYLPDPTLNLRHIVNAISRAKDELVGPAEYGRFGEEMASTATSDEEREAAAKVLEVANAYRVYQEALDAESLLDFGDLIYKAVRLLSENTDVREEVRRTHVHVLVDEYQDVNRASAMFLRELVGAGAGLWVVGDARQSIYRFRGASPDNMRLFRQDFPGAKVFPLRRNYRSTASIVRVVSGFAAAMPAVAGGGGFATWDVDRQATGQVAMEIADDLEAETSGLTRSIQARRAAGVAFRDQAILCRSHTWLARIGAALEAAGIPTFYLGDLFERPEVRDMLSLLSLTSEGNGSGLVRVARFSEYRIPLADVLKLFELARDNGRYFPEALALARDVPGISDQGKASISLLADHLAGVHYGMRAWTVLSSYLFVHSDYLRPLLADDSVGGQQRRLALYQLLRFAGEYRSRWVTRGKVNPRHQFLQHVRWLEELGEEKQLRQMPSWAEGVDAVRLLTVHASKGLEFDSVYMPTLGRGIFPANPQGRPCPPPPRMVDASPQQHDAEEACLFFVALSRAMDFLCLSRAERYSSARRTNPSPLLETIGNLLPRAPGGTVSWLTSGAATVAAAVSPTLPTGRQFTADELDRYRKCPREYFYRHVLQVHASSGGSAYVQFHRCVYAVLRWLNEQYREGQQPDASATLQRLAEVWALDGPRTHPHEPLYRRVAESMVERASARRRLGVRTPSPEWEVVLPQGRVILQPDDLEDLPDGTLVAERLRTGRPTKNEVKKDIYALYLVAARQAAGTTARVQVRFLSSDTVLPVSLSDRELRTRLAHYGDAIVGISTREFSPNVQEHRCPRCAYYFICPTAEDK